MTRLRGTVAICTYDRYDTLGAALESLAAQTLAAADFEIIVVDNSPDRRRSLREARRYRSIANLRWRHVAQPGLSNARNIAWRAARSPVIAFLDDDAIAEPDWLEHMLAAYDVLGDEAHGIGGRVTPMFVAEPPTWLSTKLMDYLSVIDRGEAIRFLGPYEWVAGANLSYRVAALRQAGGFNPSFGRMGPGLALMSNDEMELDVRIKALGGQIGYTPFARVAHRVEPSRLTQEWFRRRGAWQAVSDFLLKPAEMHGSSQYRYHTLGQFFTMSGSGTMLPLAAEQPDGETLSRQMAAIYDAVTCLLSGVIPPEG